MALRIRGFRKPPKIKRKRPKVTKTGFRAILKANCNKKLLFPGPLSKSTKWGIGATKP